MLSKSILVISGPNLNLLGDREEKYYGQNSLDSIHEKIKKIGNLNEFDIECRQSNSESEIIEWIQSAKNNFQAIIINAGGYTHTSVAIRDSLNVYKKPIIELHISNIYKRENFRHKSLISDIATGGIFGLGVDGYILAINSMQKLLQNGN